MRRPFLHVRRGLTRTVLVTRRHAVKVPSPGVRGRRMWAFTRGVQANLSEAVQTGTPGVCPVLFGFAGLVNVYPRALPVPHDPTDAEYDAIGYTGPVDRKPSNVGLLAGRLVWIDYDASWNDCRATCCDR